MTHEILDHAYRILGGSPTRTMTARSLHSRTAADLGVTIPFNRFLAMLDAARDRVTIVAERTVGVGWTNRDRQRYSAALERAGLERGATVMLVEQPPAPDHSPPERCSMTQALSDTLADAHAAVAELLSADRSSGVMAGSLEDAVAALDELQQACTADLGGDDWNV